jgi:hypothetical protein
MIDELVPIVMFLSFAYALVGVTRAISDGRTRRKLAESGASPELAKALTAPSRDPGLGTSLQFGLVAGAIGVALIIIQFLPYRTEDPIAAGLILVFAAAGLLGYYALARRQPTT